MAGCRTRSHHNSGAAPCPDSELSDGNDVFAWWWILHQDFRYQTSPACLMARATAAPRVAMEVFVKRDESAPIRVTVEQGAVSKDRPLALRVQKENARQPSRNFPGNFIQIHDFS